MLLAVPGQRILFERTPTRPTRSPSPACYLAGADIVLVEGFKQAPVPKVEVFGPPSRPSLSTVPTRPMRISGPPS